MNYEIIKKSIDQLKGKIGFYYKDLNSGTSFGVNENESFIAASMIKIPVLIEAYRQFRQKSYLKKNLLK